MVELASTRGFITNMRATYTKHSLLHVCVLSSFIFLLCSTSTGVKAGEKMASHQPTVRRSRRSHQSAKLRGAHHRPLTDEQKADQNLQFMLSLYKSAAEPDGRPKQHRKFGSNTVRLLRPSASSVRYLPASSDHHCSFTVEYNLDTLPSEQLIRASFIHLRSSSPSSPNTTSSTTQVLELPRCRAQITSLGTESLVTMEAHERWTETDITAHVQQGVGGHLTLTVLYWCTQPGNAEEDSSLLWWWTRLQGRKVWRGEPDLEVPSLLLYLEEEREVKDWMGDLLGAEGENLMRQIGQWHPSARRRRRSKDPTYSEARDLSLDALKNAPTSSSSFASSPSASIISDISDIPNYKRKTSMPKNRCKLHSFRLSFEKLGWGHYFIAPPLYNPRFCQGNCPRVLHYGYHSPNHAIIQTVINDLGIGDVPLPSCVPFKYMPMSVLVVHKKKVEYRELEDMVAESCTCR
ncbi:bone morphogenetic protein 15-like [Micropterus salmoides]|uniref:bone morphogenetic protein 15-like n=1 Tax=Micropterus salmoides TaxID=27706 RepID=UPI0018ECCC32|nr:bone morphogenetic protein 15-like [Micropterus salmoides]